MICTPSHGLYPTLNWWAQLHLIVHFSNTAACCLMADQMSIPWTDFSISHAPSSQNHLYHETHELIHSDIKSKVMESSLISLSMPYQIWPQTWFDFQYMARIDYSVLPPCNLPHRSHHQPRDLITVSFVSTLLLFLLPHSLFNQPNN